MYTFCQMLAPLLGEVAKATAGAWLPSGAPKFHKLVPPEVGGAWGWVGAPAEEVEMAPTPQLPGGKGFWALAIPLFIITCWWCTCCGWWCTWAGGATPWCCCC